MNFKYAQLLIVAALAFTAVSCSDDDDYSAGPLQDNAFYMPDDQNNEFLDIEPGDNSFTFEVARPVGGPACDATLVYDADPVFNIPSTVHFAEGEKRAAVTVTFNVADLLMKDYYISVGVTPEEACSYGDSQIDIVAGVADHLRWKSLGTGLYRDAFLCELFEEDLANVDWSEYQYECEILEHKYYTNTFRLVKPYGKGGSFDINCQDPDGAYIQQTNLGQVIPGYNLYVYSMAANYLNGGNSLAAIKRAGYCGKLVDGCITFPATTLLTAFPPALGSFARCNSLGEFLVMLPSAYASTPVPPVVVK